jgi:Fur family ferric uptake transcriptional regulator
MSDIQHIFETADLRLTKQRRLIIDVFLRHKKPITAQTIISELSEQLDPVTVYRNVEQLSTSGILKNLQLGERAAYYEINHNDDHHHIICKICRRIESIEICDNHQLEKQALDQSKKFVQITKHMLEFEGVCKQCK